MKQPELGQKIQEWRKAKGLTQEELVEKCNINVRTIQRIEAGEVTPRSFTIKAIMEVLEVKQELEGFPESKLDEVQFSPLSKKIFLGGAIAGIIYFFVSIFEFYWDGTLYLSSNLDLPAFYFPVKLIVLFTYTAYIFGFFELGRQTDSRILQVSAVLLMLANIVYIFMDIMFLDMFATDYKLYGIAKVVSFGLLMMPFSIGLILIHNKLGTVFLAAGGLGMLAAILFSTFILSMFALIVLTVFDVLAIYLLFSVYSQRFFLYKTKFDNSNLILS
ncbi:helix-turn-helix domain-containing protein [Belliella marina]|uniref:Helix-turn-helix domain-containing protein n=1 Tax=Belliella marina TaxID=1644146 RepID=A0ABW4VTG2_9BACT